MEGRCGMGCSLARWESLLVVLRLLSRRPSHAHTVIELGRDELVHVRRTGEPSCRDALGGAAGDWP